MSLSWHAFRALYKRLQRSEAWQISPAELDAYREAMAAYKLQQPILIEQARRLVERLDIYHQAVLAGNVVDDWNRSADAWLRARRRLARRERNHLGPQVDQREIWAENQGLPWLKPRD